MSQTTIRKESMADAEAVSTSTIKWQIVASYHWNETKDKPDANILIPGCPSLFKGIELADRIQLRTENCEEFIDPNKAHQLNCPTEAIFRSLEVCGKLNDVSTSVDVITGLLSISLLYP